MIQNRNQKDIFNVDKTVVFFCTPAKKIKFKEDKCHGGKLRLTL